MHARFAPIALSTVIGAVVGLCPSMAHADWPTDPAVNLPVCTAVNNQTAPAIAGDAASLATRLGGFHRLVRIGRARCAAGQTDAPITGHPVGTARHPLGATRQR